MTKMPQTNHQLTVCFEANVARMPRVRGSGLWQIGVGANRFSTTIFPRRRVLT